MIVRSRQIEGISKLKVLKSIPRLTRLVQDAVFKAQRAYFRSSKIAPLSRLTKKIKAGMGLSMRPLFGQTGRLFISAVNPTVRIDSNLNINIHLKNPPIYAKMVDTGWSQIVKYNQSKAIYKKSGVWVRPRSKLSAPARPLLDEAFLSTRIAAALEDEEI
ncbi:hypothetical protein D6779_11100 [Candidatus Parcubacteria bacterium]|nr:MAG: hypothetical protein D6779_11100 [Candidatus Parcubacteria bacterium]